MKATRVPELAPWLAPWLVITLAAAAPAGCRGVRQERPRVVVNNVSFFVEVAEEPAELFRGLSNRRELACDEGMLFIFPRPQELLFHMKDCYFPIDLAFLDDQRRIICLEEMAVEADPARPVRHYRSVQPARYALETPGGTWEGIGAKVGMSVTFIDVPGH